MISWSHCWPLSGTPTWMCSRGQKSQWRVWHPWERRLVFICDCEGQSWKRYSKRQLAWAGSSLVREEWNGWDSSMWREAWRAMWLGFTKLWKQYIWQKVDENGFPPNPTVLHNTEILVKESTFTPLPGQWSSGMYNPKKFCRQTSRLKKHQQNP